MLCREDRGGNHLCVFISEAHPNPLTIIELCSALASAINEKRFFVMDRCQSLSYRTGKPEDLVFFCAMMVEPDEVLILIIRSYALRWILNLSRYLDNDLFDELGSTLQGMEKELGIRKQERPFQPSSLKPRAAKRTRPMVIPHTPPETPERLPQTPLRGYTKEKEIEDILARAEGDCLTDDQIYVLTQLGYFT